MENKNITIIIPAYNSHAFIERALASFISNRKFIYEVIIVDDCSDQSYDEIVDWFRPFYKISLYRNKENYGAGVSRRVGIIKAKSEWITFVDADDCITPNSLRYVENFLDENTILLHTQTIYYETGFFDRKNINHSDGSCGGNFYRREYLIRHNLLPSLELRRCEDEFFNEKIDFYIDLNNQNNSITRYDYPVYEVHHDFDDTPLSLALSDMKDYFCCSRLKATKIFIDDFFTMENKERLEYKFFKDIYFVYLLTYGLSHGDESYFDETILTSFKESIKHYSNKFKKTKADLIEWVKNYDEFEGLLWGAKASVGDFDYEKGTFESFLKNLEI